MPSQRHQMTRICNTNARPSTVYDLSGFSSSLSFPSQPMKHWPHAIDPRCRPSLGAGLTMRLHSNCLHARSGNTGVHNFFIVLLPNISPITQFLAHVYIRENSHESQLHPVAVPPALSWRVESFLGFCVCALERHVYIERVLTQQQSCAILKLHSLLFSRPSHSS